jgi:peptide/nickel transport system substrate-binding protein
MNLFGWRLLAVSSLLLVASAFGATRPQYGGTLRIMTRTGLASLDPADASQPDTIFRRDLDRLLYDTLVTIDNSGHLQPALAISWKSDSGYQRWEFRIRPGVTFEDGSPLTPTAVAASLRVLNPKWGVSALADSVLIETDSEQRNLAAQLAEPKCSVVKRVPGKILGTGPFHATDWQPGKSVSLAANEDYWAGRPFLNSIEIALAKSYRDQALALQVGRTDAIEVAPEQARRPTVDARSAESTPIELVALIFARDPESPDDRQLREAFSLSIDRASIKSVLLQGTGEPTASLLPNWISGYSFLFPYEADIAKARQERSEVRQTPNWTLAYDGGDPLSRLIAERVALNAREAGITIQPGGPNGANIRLVRIPLTSTDGALALTDLANAFGLPAPNIKDVSPQALYQAESSLLQTERVVPLLYLPLNYALGNSVKNCQVRRDGTRDFSDVWLPTEKP